SIDVKLSPCGRSIINFRFLLSDENDRVTKLLITLVSTSKELFRELSVVLLADRSDIVVDDD
ncbi:unnamed protein product, partial [Rotaria magnacalcarata]